ncbi:hypothetical protein [Dongia sp.]|uniref:hypothetical protein n=1 Tax=Dongia sp. TaxID=1977262 RepID=UPI0035B1CA66
MTKRRDAGSFEEAMMRIVKLLGATQAAEIVNLSPKTIRDYSDPARAGRPRLAEAVKLDMACLEKAGEAPLFDAYLKSLADIVPEPAGTPQFGGDGQDPGLNLASQRKATHTLN